MADRRLDPLRALQRGGYHTDGARGATVEEPLARRAGLSTAQRRVGAGPLRGALVAGLSPPRHHVLPGLRVLATGATAQHADGAAGCQLGPGACPPFPCIGPDPPKPRPRPTLPAIRRALQPLLACPCPLDCPWCKVQFAYASGFT